MSPKSKIQSFKFAARAPRLFYFLPFAFYFLLCACGLSIPNLEQKECIEARTVIKEFYSYHFGNDMNPAEGNLEKREKYLTESLKRELVQRSETATDYFTQTDDYPKAFSVGSCEAVSPDKTLFDVLLFWKDDTRTEQREIKVELVKQDGRWLLNKVNL